jgi:hypothetical protein
MKLEFRGLGENPRNSVGIGIALPRAGNVQCLALVFTNRAVPASPHSHLRKGHFLASGLAGSETRLL